MVDFQILEALKRYSSDNFMGGMDNMDKGKKIGGFDFVMEQQLSDKTYMIIAGHQPQSIPSKVKLMCCVCNLE